MRVDFAEPRGHLRASTKLALCERLHIGILKKKGAAGSSKQDG